MKDSDDEYRVDDPKGTPEYAKGRKNKLMIKNENDSTPIIVKHLQ